MKFIERHKRVITFILFFLIWKALDMFLGNTTDTTDILVIGFFLIWNETEQKKEEHREIAIDARSAG